MSFQVFQQRCNGFVTRFSVNAMTVLQPTVLVPPINPLARGRQQFDKADTPLYQPPRQETLEAKLLSVGLIEAVELPSRL